MRRWHPRRLVSGQSIHIELEIHDSRLTEESRVTVAAVVEEIGGGAIADLELERTDPGEHRYTASYRPGRTGELRVRVDDPDLADLALQVPVEVFAPDDELRRPETDHPLLVALAGETGGHVVWPKDLDGLPALLPNRSVRTINPLTERIWDTPLAFGLILLVLAAEWIGRKAARLA